MPCTYSFARVTSSMIAASALWNATSSIADSTASRVRFAWPDRSASAGSPPSGAGTAPSKYFPSIPSVRFRRFPSLSASSELARLISSFSEKSPSSPKETSRRRK